LEGRGDGCKETLNEAVTFDTGKVTSTDWRRYKILTMEEIPEINVVLASHDDRGYGMTEGDNALPPPAIVAAFFDATGVQPRRLPLTPDYVKALLKG
jgi:CO/xanthine dehydrogenase Mo-binding subunit